MTLDEFETLIAVHGSAIESWPTDSRQAVQGLLDTNAAARKFLGQQQRLDRLLAADTVAPAPAHLKVRIMAALDAVPPVSPVVTASPAPSLMARLGGLFATPWPRLAGFVAASVVGFVVGFADPFTLPLGQPDDLSGYIIGYDSETISVALQEVPGE